MPKMMEPEDRLLVRAATNVTEQTRDILDAAAHRHDRPRVQIIRRVLDAFAAMDERKQDRFLKSV
jgi:hypothetical protein